MGLEIEPQAGTVADSVTSAPPPYYPGPLDWLGQSGLRNWLLLRSAAIFGIAVALATVLAIVAILLIAEIGAALTSGLSSGGIESSSSVPAPSLSQLFSAFMVVLGFFFFTAHLAPYGGVFSAASFNAYGIGSISIALAVMVVAYRSGRQAERRFPTSRSNAEAAMRAFFLAVPYWVGCLVLFLLSTLHFQNQLFGGDVTLGPSPLGLVTPLILVGGSATVGALRERRPALSPSSVFALRGAVIALFAIGVALVGSVIGGILALLISAAGHSSTFNANPTGSSSPNLPSSAPSLGSSGPLIAVMALVVAIFFIPNGLFWLWGTALGLRFESAGWLILIFGVVGAFIGALPIQRRAGATEQITFALTFGFVSFLLALISRPTLGAYALGADPLTALIVGVIVGGAAAFGGPYAATTSLGRSVLAQPLLQFAIARLPLPELGAAPFTPPAPSGAPGPARQAQPVQLTLPAFKFGKRERLAGAVVVVLIVVAIGANIFLSGQTTPDAVAVAYVNAVGSNNADAIWSHVTVQAQNLTALGSAGNTPQLLSEADLKAMLTLPQNSHSSRSNVSVGNSIVRGDTAAVSVTYTEGGQRHTDTLTLIRDRASNLFLFYPNWKVSQTPGLIGVNLPTQTSQVAIDHADLPAGANAAFVLPGAHLVTLLSAGPFASTDELEIVQPGVTTAVSFQNLTLTAAARTAAAQAIQGFFATCAQQTMPSSGDCPQQLGLYTTNPVTWKLVGDPAKDASYSVDPNSQSVVAAGHFLMTAELTSDSGTLHRVSGGPFALTLAWNGSAFTAQEGAYFAGQLKPLPDPQADKTAILGAVKAGWDKCLKATTLTPPDCPFYTSAYSPSAISWASTADPMAGAAISWDGSEGIYKVTGNCAVVASYTTPNGPEQQPVNCTYSAEVLWDGQKANLVDIQ